MAKMFYTLDEAASKLGMSENEVMGMVSSGQLSEFRDGDQLRFKVEQVDLLMSGDDDIDAIPLASDESGLGLSLEDSTPSPGPNFDIDDTIAETPKEQSGISIFDADDMDEADSAADTLITNAPGEFGMESVGSGSGLLDLTQEADDTSLGADLLEDVYSDLDEGDAQGASGLFEETSAASDVSAFGGDAAMAGAAAAGIGLVAAEPLDAGFSGFTGGAMLGGIVVLGATFAAILSLLLGATQNPILTAFQSQVPMGWMGWTGGAAGLILICGIIGWLIGRRG